MQNPFEHGLTLANGQHIEAKYMTSIMVALERWHGKEIYDFVLDEFEIEGAPDELTDEIYYEIYEERTDKVTGEDEKEAVLWVLEEHGYDVKEVR